MSNFITHLVPNEIFCYGANLAGRHGKGAAKQALQWGAIYGKIGQTYGIPTKDENIKTLPLYDIKKHVDEFIEYAKANSHLTFLMTTIGTGLAGLQICDIAPMFAAVPDNVKLPMEFIEYLKL